MVLSRDLDRWLHRLSLAERMRLERADVQMEEFRHRHEQGNWWGRKRIRPRCRTPGCTSRLGVNNRSGYCTACGDKVRKGATCGEKQTPDTEG